MNAAPEAVGLGEVANDVGSREPFAPQATAAIAAPARAEVRAPTASLWQRGSRFLRTARQVPPLQLAARAHFILLRRVYAVDPARPIARARAEAAGCDAHDALPDLPPELVLAGEPAGLEVRAHALAAGEFTFVGRSVDFSAGIRWQDPTASPLWRFNLHYLGGLVDLVAAGRVDAAAALLSSWRAAFEARWDPVAWHPYPVSLRLANLCFAAAQAGGFEALGAGAAQLTATHVAFLLRHLEHDLRGNHLLENAFALVAAGRFLSGPLAARADRTARALLQVELPEQVLADGGHFELSPMYHAIVLQRLLQIASLLGSGDPLVRDLVTPAADRMATFLRVVRCPDGDIPLLGDSVRDFAPAPQRLLNIAGGHDDDSAPGRTSLPDTGLHVLRSRRVWAILDAGHVCPDYLPGHGQADSLTLEVWCDGACLVTDPGVHEYTGPERAWGRSSRAHSTITLNDADTSEVYDSFRVGGRAQMLSVFTDTDSVTATLAPFASTARLTRTIRVRAETLRIDDGGTATGGQIVRSRLHLHPEVQIQERLNDGHAFIVRTAAGFVRIDAEHPLHVERGRASRRYGSIEPTTILVHTLGGDETVRGRLSIQPMGHR